MKILYKSRDLLKFLVLRKGKNAIAIMGALKWPCAASPTYRGKEIKMVHFHVAYISVKSVFEIAINTNTSVTFE